MAAVQEGGLVMGTEKMALPFWQPPKRAHPVVMSHQKVREVTPEGICELYGRGDYRSIKGLEHQTAVGETTLVPSQGTDSPGLHPRDRH